MTAEWLDAGADTTRLPSPNGRKLQHRAITTAKALTRAAQLIPQAEARTRGDAPGQPGAASYDAPRVGGSRSQSWCWLHERPTSDCDRSGLICDGEPIAVQDPTGEAAIALSRDDLERQITATLRKAETAAVDLLALLDRALATATPPSERDLRDTAKANESDPGCHWCAKVTGPSGVKAWWNPAGPGLDAYSAGGTVKAGPTCSACYRFITSRGRAPTLVELARKRDTERWPQEHESNTDAAITTKRRG